MKDIGTWSSDGTSWPSPENTFPGTDRPSRSFGRAFSYLGFQFLFCTKQFVKCPVTGGSSLKIIPPEEDTKKQESWLKAEEKKLAKNPRNSETACGE
jgi:hypothetical protein